MSFVETNKSIDALLEELVSIEDFNNEEIAVTKKFYGSMHDIFLK